MAKTKRRFRHGRPRGRARGRRWLREFQRHEAKRAERQRQPSLLDPVAEQHVDDRAPLFPTRLGGERP